MAELKIHASNPDAAMKKGRRRDASGHILRLSLG
jgi:hypothetical protein